MNLVLNCGLWAFRHLVVRFTDLEIKRNREIWELAKYTVQRAKGVDGVPREKME